MSVGEFIHTSNSSIPNFGKILTVAGEGETNTTLVRAQTGLRSGSLVKNGREEVLAPVVQSRDRDVRWLAGFRRREHVEMIYSVVEYKSHQFQMYVPGNFSLLGCSREIWMDVVCVCAE